MSNELGTLVEINELRNVWPNEADDFTPWLASEENIQILSKALHLNLEVIDMEASVGAFSADIFARDLDSDNLVIIENQLTETDHKHLGQIITYASGKNANTLIWITKCAREEHQAAVEWLNNHLDSDLGVFLCEIKLYKIDDSNPAVKFEVIERPNGWLKSEKNSGGSERKLYREKLDGMSGPIENLYNEITNMLLDLNPSITGEYKKYYETLSSHERIVGSLDILRSCLRVFLKLDETVCDGEFVEWVPQGHNGVGKAKVDIYHSDDVEKLKELIEGNLSDLIK